MASNELKVHRLGLRRLVVEGNLQPIVRFATLTLKDEEHGKQIMQLHVDGETLAQWDLGMLRERKLTGGEKFFTNAEQNMLQFTLPLFEKDGQKVASMKTIQLFILNVKDFHTAVDYLSKNAGMQHCHINKVLQNLRGVSVPKLAPISKSQESPGTSTMGPPMLRLIGRPMRPQSQTSVHAPVRYSPSQPVYRSQTARPNLTLAPGSSSRSSSTPGNAVLIHGQTPSQGNHHWPSPLMGPLDPRSSVVPGDSSLPRRLLSAGPGVGDLGERKQLYEQPIHIASMRSHMSSRPVRHDSWKFPPSSSQVKTDTGTLPDEPYHDRFHGQSASQSDRILPPASRTVSNRIYPFKKRPSSRPPTERPASPFSPFSDHRVPIRIQVLSLPDEPRYSHPYPEIRWEFTLHLLPSTKMYELCLHAASYIRREWRVTVDGRALAAQKMDGTLFEDQYILSDEILQGQAILLVERRFLSTAQSAPVKPSGSYPEPLHPDCRPEAGMLGGSHPASTRDPLRHAFDETDQVPPPRELPFRLAATPAPPRSSSSTAAARSPLSERPDLMNSNAQSRANKTLTQPVSQNIRTEAATKKQPKDSQKRPITALRRPASSASGSKLESMSVAAEVSEPQTLARRPETPLGIRRKRKTPSGDEGLSAAMRPVTGSILSDNEVSTRELVTSSCVGCRNKKRKCDRSKPACGACLKDKRPCTYPNIPKVAATGRSPEKTFDRPVLDTAAHPMILRSQALASPPMVSDALTQTSHPMEYRNIGSQTQGIEHGDQNVEMKDVGTDPYNLYTDASTGTDRCDDLWVPFSQCAQVVLWAGNQYERQIQKAAEILTTTDPSHDDYQEKVAQAAVHAWEFEEEFREKYEQAFKG